MAAFSLLSVFLYQRKLKYDSSVLNGVGPRYAVGMTTDTDLQFTTSTNNHDVSSRNGMTTDFAEFTTQGDNHRDVAARNASATWKVHSVIKTQMDSFSHIYMEKQANCAQEFSKPRKTVVRTWKMKKEAWHMDRDFDVLGPDFYTKATRNCSHFIKSRGYIMSSLSAEEASFSIAYSIVAYNDLEMLERLLRSVYRPEHVFCIHIDIKSPEDYFQAVTGIANCFPNVFLALKRIDVQWGKFSVLEPDLVCMDALWEYKKKWKYFINLTGQEFPLKTNSELVKILTAYNGANDVGVALE